MRIREIEKRTLAGIPMLLLLLSIQVAAIAGIFYSLANEDVNVPLLVGSILVEATDVLFMIGLFMVHPNESKVLQLFGRYVGTETRPGLRWANPFFSKQAVSKRVRNFETDKLKVNDQIGNPIEIGAVVVWRVVDTAEAVFEVDDYENYVHVQSEAALRNLATGYPYDAHEAGGMSLSGNTSEISAKLKTEVQDRLDKAGVEVIESRISYLAYAPEIAAAMLQRQQASAVVAARKKIVEGAVGMVDLALQHLREQGVVELDEERQAAMVSNLMVVLCSDRHTQPVVNTGTLHN